MSSRTSAARDACTVEAPLRRYRARVSAPRSSRPSCSTAARSAPRCASVSRCQVASNSDSCSPSSRVSVPCRSSRSSALRAVGAGVVPQLVREALHVVRQVAGELDDRLAEAGRALDAACAHARLDERRESIRRDPSEPYDRSGLVERPAPAEHALHERRLRAGKDVADVALHLDGGAQRMLDAAAVEGGNRLELVERDGQLAAAAVGDPAGQREDLLRQPRHVAVAARRRERHGERSLAGRRAIDPHFRPHRRQRLAQPRHRAPGLLLDRRQRARIAFEKADVRAVAADGDVDDQRAAAGGGGERSPDQRRLAVAARRDEEHLLAGEQIAGEAVELVFAIDERGLGDDLAIDEGVGRHYAVCRNSYGDYRNGGTGAIAPH